MFFLFHGDDTVKARSVANKNLEAAKKKHPDAGFFKLTVESSDLALTLIFLILILGLAELVFLVANLEDLESLEDLVFAGLLFFLTTFLEVVMADSPSKLANFLFSISNLLINY